MVQQVLNNYNSIMQSIEEQTDFEKMEIEKKIEKRVKDYAGLLTEAGAAYAIAKENNVETGFEPEPKKINQIEASEINLRVKAIVQQAWPLNKWERGERSGCVRNFLLKDDTGQKKFVIWNNEDISEKIKIGQELLIEGAYSKENNGFIEIHASDKSFIKLGQVVLEKQQTQLVKKTFTECKENDFVSGEGEIQSIYQLREFQRGDKVGKVRNLIFKSENKSYNLVFWDDKTDLVDGFSIADKINLENVRARINRLNGNIEFHFAYNSKMDKVI